MKRVLPANRIGENARPPRYRLLAAAAKLPQRQPVDPSEIFERDCPTCGRPVLFKQVQYAEGSDYLIEEHDCT